MQLLIKIVNDNNVRNFVSQCIQKHTRFVKSAKEGHRHHVWLQRRVKRGCKQYTAYILIQYCPKKGCVHYYVRVPSQGKCRSVSTLFIKKNVVNLQKHTYLIGLISDCETGVSCLQSISQSLQTATCCDLCSTYVHEPQETFS